ncbi:hypothetical protein VP01_1206g2 [Puccinia sorghi]|uniref:Uncharacterized protein n=1 Tax=Puccinia sorghi TaxID=27349 RepID=A0A0L6VRW6_9BASI|nr:hypothetical protein VP01_1206g2 [Puccinia sorghi]
MPFVSGKASSFFTVGAKTWLVFRNSQAWHSFSWCLSEDQQFLERQRKRMAEEEQMKKAEVQQRIKTVSSQLVHLSHIHSSSTKCVSWRKELRLLTSWPYRTLGVVMDIYPDQALWPNSDRFLILLPSFHPRNMSWPCLEIAKREGRESLSEADLARIKNERLRTEGLARAARDHAIRENLRPVTPVSMGPARVPVPPPPIPHPLPPHNRPPSAQSMHRPHLGPSVVPSGHIPNTSMGPRLGPPEPAPRMRRMSESLVHPPGGIGRAPTAVPNLPRGLGPAPYQNRHVRRPSGIISAEMTLKAQAERLRRKRLETLDLKARQHNLKVQALRDLRKRELIAELRERGLQQREIETQVNLQAERDRALTEAQLREIRDRDHRLRLKEKGLQEREILDHLRRRQENDREALRRELELLEHQLRRKEILEAELAIKRAMEKGESPPMGVCRPSIEEIETEGLLNDIYDDLDIMGPHHRHEALSESAMSAEYRPRTPTGGHSFASVGSRTPSMNPLVRTPSVVGLRTPHLRHLTPGPSIMTGAQVHDRLHDEQMREEIQMRQDLLNIVSARAPALRQGTSRQPTPQPHLDVLDNNRLSVGGGATPRMRGEEHLGDNLARTPGRSRSQSFDHRRPSSAAMTARDREESQGRAREASRSRRNSQVSLNREEVMSIARAESRAALREEIEAREQRERTENKTLLAQRLRDELRAREEQNRLNSGLSHLMATPALSRIGTPSIGQMGTPSMGHHIMPNQAMAHQTMPTPSTGHRRTSSMMDNLDPNRYHDNHHLEAHVRPSSRASSRLPDYNSISRPVSRAGSIRADYSPTQPRLGLPSRPSSRNLTAEDLGLQFERESAERIPHMNAANNDALLLARLQSAAVNSEINGGRRSRANSRVDPMDDEYRHIDRSHLATDLNAMNLNGGRSRTNSRAEMPGEDFLRNARSQLANDFEVNHSMSGMRSRSNSQMGLTHEGLSPNQRREHLGSELANVGGRRSRASSIAQGHGMSPSFHNDSELQGSLIGPGRSPCGNLQPDLYASEPGLGNLTNEELSQLSTEQLEQILTRQGDRSPMRKASSSWAVDRGDDRSFPMDELGNILGRPQGGSMGGMNNLDVGEGHSRGYNHRGSRLAVEESPLFGDPRDYQSPIDPPRPLSRAETSSGRQYGGYIMPSYDDPYLSADVYPDDDGSGGRFDSEAGYMNDDEFIITEKAEQPGARIRQDAHQAVRNLIRMANRLGANGVVSLRVLDASDGSYIATGEAVYLETK